MSSGLRKRFVWNATCEVSKENVLGSASTINGAMQEAINAGQNFESLVYTVEDSHRAMKMVINRREEDF